MSRIWNVQAFVRVFDVVSQLPRNVFLVIGAGLTAAVVACASDGDDFTAVATSEVASFDVTSLEAPSGPASADRALPGAEPDSAAGGADINAAGSPGSGDLGDPAPVALALGPGVHDFTLPSTDGDEISLSGFLGEKNVVIVFYRAFW